MLTRKRKQKAGGFEISHFYWLFASNVMAVKGVKKEEEATSLCTLSASGAWCPSAHAYL